MDRLNLEDLKSFIDSRKWLYAARQGLNGKLICLYFGTDDRYWVEESNGYKQPTTMLYEGNEAEKAVDVYNDMTVYAEET